MQVYLKHIQYMVHLAPSASISIIVFPLPCLPAHTHRPRDFISFRLQLHPPTLPSFHPPEPVFP